MNQPLPFRRRPGGAPRVRRLARRRVGTVLLTAVTAVLTVLAFTPVSSAAVVRTAEAQMADAQAAAGQVLTWTAGDSVTGYTSAPATATAGAATIVFENSAATGNTTGMPHSLTFATDKAGYNNDVNVDILANPYDSNGGRWEVQVNLSAGTYYYYCKMAGHQMSGELVVTGDGGQTDTTAPTVSAEVSGQQDANGAYVGSATVTATAQDAGSGVASIEYEIDDTGFQPYSAPVVVDKAGDHSVQVRATDKAGNVSEVKSVAFTVVEATPADTTAPQVSAAVTGDQDADGAYVGSATVTLTAQDSESGVASVEYALDGGSFASYSAPVTVDQAGEHTVSYRATDNAGNVSDPQSVTFTVVEPAPADTTAPSVSAEVSGEQDANGAYVGSATVTITAQDSGSGVESVEYSLDGAPYAVVTGPVEVSQPGQHTLSYRATDKAGNVSEVKSVAFTVVEATPPADGTCPGEPTSDTVVIDGMDTGVEDVDAGDGCTVSELIRPWASYDSHGAFVSHVDHVVNRLAEDGVLTGTDPAAIKRTAARSDVGRPLELLAGADPLAGWAQAGPGSFSVEEDGVIASHGGMGLLWYKPREFGAYTLHLDFRLTDPSNNSGVFVGFPDVGDDPWVAVRQGEEVQINDNPAGDPQKTGAVYNEKPADRQASRPVGEWNSYDIVVDKESITVYLNGTQVNHWVDDDPAVDLADGYIGLQNHPPTSVQFRNVTVNEAGPPASD
jgi:hypothetical protein